MRRKIRGLECLGGGNRLKLGENIRKIGVQKPHHLGIVEQLLDIAAGTRQVQDIFTVGFLDRFKVAFKRFHLMFQFADLLLGQSLLDVKEGLTQEQIGKLEHEMESLERDLKSVEESYGENVLNLTCARGYIKKLLDNAKVVRFLNANFADIFSEFESIASTETL